MSSKLLDEAVLDRQSQENLHNTNLSLRGSPGQGYYLEMAVGTPPQMIDALVDTGSSNFAVAASPHDDIEKFFNVSASRTLIDLGTQVSVPYTQGQWKGFLGQDVVQLSASDNSSISTNIAFITESENFFINGSHWEGILGLAYREIARPNSGTEPFFDSLLRQTGISNVFSLQLCGLSSVTSSSRMVGSLILGGIDESLYTGTITYVPIYKEWYYEVVITDIDVGDASLEMDCKEYNFDKTIVDSGTTNLRLPTRVFDRLVELLTEKTQYTNFIPSIFWKGLDLLCWKHGKVPWEDFPNITLTLAASHNTSLDLVVSPRNYLRPIGDEESGSSAESDCYKFSVAPSDSGTVIGAIVMEGFYVIFDRHNAQIGFAQTACPAPDSSAVLSSTRGPYYSLGNGFDCAYVKPEGHSGMLMIATCVMGAICVLCIIPLVLLVIRWQVMRCRFNRRELDQSNLLNEQER